MSYVYHHTSSLHLPWILESGELRPGRNKSGRFTHDDFLWATTDPRGDRTATPFILNGIDVYRAGLFHHVRFTLAETDFFPWREARIRHPEWTEEDVKRLEREAENPANWHCRATPLPLRSVVTIEHRSYANNAWRQIESRDVLRGDHDGELCFGIEVEGKHWFSRRFTNSWTGADGYSPVYPMEDAA